MELLPQVFRPRKGQHRLPRTERQKPDTSPAPWLVDAGDPAEVSDLAVDMLLGYDPRDRFL